MSEYQILSVKETEKLWNKGRTSSNRDKYPWRKMKIGESFVFVNKSLCDKNYRPTLTCKLLSEGYRIAYSRLTEDTVQIKRIA
jgi:hypothetical protein